MRIIQKYKDGLGRSVIQIETNPCFHCRERGTVHVLAEQYEAWQNGIHAQDAFPEMPAEDREMLISGTHPACWDAMFAEEE